MRILLLTQWFDPEPTSKGLAFARALLASGHDVEVLTGFPNYPGGTLYDGYKLRPFKREVMDGVQVVRVPLYPSHDSNARRRIANYASFALAATTLAVPLLKKPDVIYVHHPPLTVGLTAVLLSRLWSVPFVYDVQDLWPDTLKVTGMVRSERVLSTVDRLCSWVYRRSAHVVVLSPGFREALIERGVPDSKVDVIFNWCDEGQLKLQRDAEIRARLQSDSRFTVVFAGTIGRAQGLGNVVDAAALLAREAPRVSIVFVGSGIEAQALERRAASEGLENVTFVPRMPMSDVGKVLDAADVLLVHLADEPLFEITIPGKTQAYMSVGKPILIAVRGDAANLVEKSGGGIACRPGDPRNLADAIVSLEKMQPELLRAMGERGRTYYESELSLNEGVQAFLRVFERITA